MTRPKIRFGGQVLSLVPRSEIHELRTREQAERLLSEAREQWGPSKFRHFVLQHAVLTDADDEDAVMEAAVRILLGGGLWVLEESPPVRVLDAPHTTALADIAGPSPAPMEDPARDWIGVRLVDLDEKPVAGEPYVIELPDGTELRGETDADGRARHDGVARGACRIVFPRVGAAELFAGGELADARDRVAEAPDSGTPSVDGEAAGPSAADSELVMPPDETGPPGTTWFVLEVEDGEGMPVEGEAYTLTLPSGDRRSGVLDAVGRIEVTGIAFDGACEVEFSSARLAAATNRYATGQAYLVAVTAD